MPEQNETAAAQIGDAKSKPYWVQPRFSDFFLKLKEAPEPERRLGCRTKRPLVPPPELTLEQLRENPLTFADQFAQFHDFDETLVHWVHANLIEFALACKPGVLREQPEESDPEFHHRVIMYGVPGFPGHRAYLEPSFALAKDREMTELNLNRKLRELTGLSVREWWDAVRVRYTDVREKVRDDLDTLLRKWSRDNNSALPTGGRELHALLQHARSALGFNRQVFAMDLGFKNHARLSRAFRLVTNMTLAEWECALLEELALTYAREAAEHRAVSKVTPQKYETGAAQSVSAALSASAADAVEAASLQVASATAPPGPIQAAQVA